MFASFCAKPEQERQSGSGVAPCGDGQLDVSCLSYSVLSLFSDLEACYEQFVKTGRYFAPGPFVDFLNSTAFAEFRVTVRRCTVENRSPYYFFASSDREIGECYLHTPTSDHAVGIRIIPSGPVMYCSSKPGIEIPLTFDSFVEAGGCPSFSRRGKTWLLTLEERPI